MLTVLVVISLLVSLLALLLAIAARRETTAKEPSGTDATPEDSRALRREVAALKAEQAQALRNVAVIRYDAFADTGGQLSWSLALLDDSGSGVVLSAIQGRNDSRTYAKNVTEWQSGAQLSPEEQDAISLARP
ncbi:MAG: DUF4446 family protein [Marmoricola sp.]